MIGSNFSVISGKFFKACDTSTETGRERERYRRAALTSVASMVAKGIQVGTALISLPITVRYLGTERYGLWLIISSVSTVLNFMDFGMGNGLLNAVARARGCDDQDDAARNIASAFFMLTAVSGMLLIGGAIAYPWVHWPAIFNVHSAIAAKECGPAVAVFFTLSVLSMPVAVVQRVQYGYQQGYLSTAWQAAGSVLSLVALLVAVYAHASLPWLVVAFTGGPLLSCIANFGVYFWRSRAMLRPRWSRFDRTQAGALASAGGMFFAIQIITAAGSPLDSVIIGQLLGPASVAKFGVVMKLVGMGYMVSSMFFVSMWPAYGEAFARGDYEFVRKTLRRIALLAGGLSATIALGMLLFGRWLIGWYVGPALVPALAVIGGVGTLTVANAVGDALGSFTMAVHRLKAFLIITACWTLGGLPLKLWLAKRYALTGFVWASATSYGLLFALPLILYTTHIVRNLHVSPAPIADTGESFINVAGGPL
jgi:O-antigen/teichoic acid export membrane protein